MRFSRSQSEAAGAAFGDKVNARVRKHNGVFQIKPTNRGYGAQVSDTAPDEVGFVKGDDLSVVKGAGDAALAGLLGNWGLEKVGRGWYSLVAGGMDVTVDPAPEVEAAPAAEVQA